MAWPPIFESSASVAPVFASGVYRMAREIERLRAAVAEATCHLSPEGCRLMNEAYSSVSPEQREADDAES